MKKLTALFLIGALVLGACSEDHSRYAAPQAPQQPQIVYVPTPAPEGQYPQQPPVVYQQASAPQAAQQNSGPGWGTVAAGVIGGAILGNMLSDKSRPTTTVRDVVVQDNSRRYEPSRPITIVPKKPDVVAPVTPPKPNTITALQPPKPTVVTPAPSFSPSTTYVQKQNTPTYTAPPTPPTRYAPPATTTYKSTWSSTPSRTSSPSRR